jgi:hypothetical protein
VAIPIDTAQLVRLSGRASGSMIGSPLVCLWRAVANDGCRIDCVARLRHHVPKERIVGAAVKGE